MKRFLLVLVLSLFVVSSAFGFNGVRKGFVIGGGLGLGLTSYVIEVTNDPFLGSGTTDRVNDFAFMTDFKIGYAPTNQVEIVYSDKSSWFSESGTTFLHGFGTATVNYYLKPEGPTPFISGGLGLSTLSAPFESNTSTSTGFGFYVGGGYEFAKHFAVAVDLMYGLPKDTDAGAEYAFKGFTPRVTFVATAF